MRLAGQRLPCLAAAVALAASWTSGPRPSAAVWDALAHAAGHSCIGWRQTGGCSPNGPAERHRDQSCSTLVQWRWSGYCECAGGLHSHRAACGHEEFTCEAACAAPRPAAAALPRAELLAYQRSLVGLRLADC
eukprot:SAG11_NODE_11590_length_750_cov_1.743472_1_plen_132_part_10